MANSNPCYPCFACCRLRVELIGGVDDVPDELTEWIDDDGVEICVMRQVDGACIALKNGRCSIYERRPIECVEFERGGERCDAIQQRGDR